MLFNVVEDFYNPNDLGIVTLNFLNLPFFQTYQSLTVDYGSERTNAYPCLETLGMENLGNNLSPYHILKRTLETKLNFNILHLKTFLRKTKLKELKESPCWNQHKPHVDPSHFDIAGLIFFNGSSLKDGTNFYLNSEHFEPTAVIGAKFNRCIFYSSQLPHCPSMLQQVEERWTQPFFLITKEETLKKYKESDEA